MNNELCRLLNEAVENHNDYAEDSNFLYWWDVLNEIEDMTDDEEVMDLIARIDRETERMKRKEAEERGRGKDNAEHHSVCDRESSLYARENLESIETI